MSRRLMVAVAAIAVLGASTTAAVAAKQPGKTLRIVGKTTFKPGKSVTDNQRFQSRVVQVKSGDSVKWVNKSKMPDPHTISVVSKLPKSFDCEECGAIEESHGTEEAPIQFVDKNGDGGFNEPGDSFFIPPGGGGSGELKVTAPAGSNLKLLCIIHPWMQAKLKVTK